MSKINRYNIIFMFPGQGMQYVNMGRGIYDNNRLFRTHLDQCAGLIKTHYGLELQAELFPNDVDQTVNNLDDIILSTCAIFSFEYALAKTLMSYNINPDLMIGYSIGEYVAACISDTMLLDDAIQLSIARSRLMTRLEPGKMVGVAMSREAIEALLPDDISIAADLGNSCVLSGKLESIANLENQFRQERIFTYPLNINCAGHSSLLEPMLPTFIKQCSHIRLSPPKIPYISNVTGDYIYPRQAQDIYYWATQMRATVQLATGFKTALAEPNPIFIEVGPGNALSMQVSQLDNHSSKIINLIQTKAGSQRGIDYFNKKLKELNSILKLSTHTNGESYANN